MQRIIDKTKSKSEGPAKQPWTLYIGLVTKSKMENMFGQFIMYKENIIKEWF